MNRRVVWATASALVLCITLACRTSSRQESATQFRTYVLFAPSGKGDKSYNDMALDGVVAAKGDAQFEVIEVQPARIADYESVLRSAANSGAQLVVAIGFLYVDALRKVAPDFPTTQFVVVDGDAGPLANVRSVTFKPEEGCYLVGALAAKSSKTGRIGFIAGMDIPIMHRFECGYVAGAKAAVPTIVVERRYIGSTPDAFSNPSRGREIALLMYDRGTDVIFHAAGASGIGVIQAAREKRRFVIGVDTDQSSIAPDWILSSMRKRIDKAVSQAIVDSYQHRFTGGVQVLGLKEGGVDYVPDRKHIGPELLTYLEELRGQIIAGRRTVCQ